MSTDLRLTLALAGARATGLASRLTGRGGGTAAPGLVAERLDPAALHKLGAAIPAGTIVVGGTNGKTTTAHMIATVLAHAGQRVLHNRSGSNLQRGALAALAAQSSLGGRPRGDVGVIEADEAALPAIAAALRPRFVLLNNLFRDQLDRYGELNTIAGRWRDAVAALADETTLLINADDPTLVSVAAGLPRERVVYFGLAFDPATDTGADQGLLLSALPHAADAAVCPRCGAKLAYHALYLAHLGDWHCPACGYARPALDSAARAIHLDGVTALSLTLDVAPTHSALPIPHSALPLHVPLPGLYNAYNALAAATAGLAFGVTPEMIAAALGSFTAAFGRIERVRLEGRDLTLVLVKNPAGFNEVLRMLTGGAGGALTNPALLAINDLDADGRDVSWLWDVDFEALAAGDAPLHTAGIRGPDRAVRLKYAGVVPARITPHEPNDLRGALLTFVRAAPTGSTLYVLPTYTAMLEIRRILASLGAAEQFWRQ
ncbi:MAG: MurT ligase domain-containing protein [Thermomicrobiales bacterium]